MFVPTQYWDDVVSTTCYLINRMPLFVLNNQVPHSLIFPRDDLYSLLPPLFGCACFVFQLAPTQSKLSTLSIKCVFQGYSFPSSKRVSLESARYFVYTDVTIFSDPLIFQGRLSCPSPCQIAYPCLSPFFMFYLLHIHLHLHLPLDKIDPTFQTYHRRPPHVDTLAKTVIDVFSSMLLKLPPSSQSPSLTNIDLLIALQIGTSCCTTQHLISNFVSYHSLSPRYTTCVSFLSFVSNPKTITKVFSHPRC